jgi:hypothetical protein
LVYTLVSRCGHMLEYKANTRHRVRTLTGKEIELDIEADYKVRLSTRPNPIRKYHFCTSPHPAPQANRQPHMQTYTIARKQEEHS